MTTESYFNELNEAIEFSKEIGLKIPQKIVFDTNKRYFTKDGNIKLINLYTKIFQSKLKTKSDMAMFALGMIANCSPFHYFMKKYIDKEFGCSSYLTVGYIMFNTDGKTFHKITQSDIENSLNNSQFPKDHHVWLTLDSGEILDMTFPITYQSINDKDFTSKLEAGELEIGFNNRHVSEFLHSMSYKPVIIGDEFFTRIGFNLKDVSSGLYKKYM